MNDAELNRHLTRNCTWWRRPQGWEQDDLDLGRLSDSPLSYDPDPLADIVADGLYVLRGPRRVGKSVEVKKAISSLIHRGVNARRVIHFACDGLEAAELRQLQRVGRDQATAGITESRYWFLDEITAVEDWPAAIKWLRDNTEMGRDCVVLTGSSSRDLDEASRQLAGRRGNAGRSDRLLLPMSFRSFCHQLRQDREMPDVPVIRAADFLGRDREEAVHELLPWLDDLSSLWEVYCRSGGLPPAVTSQIESGDTNAGFINDLFDIAHEDALKLSRLNATQATLLLNELTKSLGSFFNMSDLAREIDIDQKTAKARVEDLILSYLVWPCHQQGDHVFPNLAARSKHYFTDPLLARLAHLRNGRFPEPDTSLISEQQIGQHLIRQAADGNPTTYNEFSSVMCARTPARKEVDFVGPAVGRLGFEGKYSDKGLERESATVRAVCNDRGVLATRAVVGQGKEPGTILFLPASFVAYLLAG